MGHLGDVILFQTDSQYVGVIKYIGLIHGMEAMTEYIGVELIESIGKEGHNGTINNYSYFLTKKGFGTHCKLTQVLQKLSSFEIFAVFKSIVMNKNKKIKDLQDPLKQLLPSTNIPEQVSSLTTFQFPNRDDPVTPKTPLTMLPETHSANTVNTHSANVNIEESYDVFPDTEPVKQRVKRRSRRKIKSEKTRKGKEKKKRKKRRSTTHSKSDISAVRNTANQQYTTRQYHSHSVPSTPTNYPYIEYIPHLSTPNTPNTLNNYNFGPLNQTPMQSITISGQRASRLNSNAKHHAFYALNSPTPQI